MRETFLENLPRLKSSKLINWKESIGFIILFEYDNIKGELKIIKYDANSHSVTIKYLEEIFVINSCSLLNCNLGKVVGVYTKNFKIKIGTTLKNGKKDLVITNREHRDIINKYGISKGWKYYKYTCNKCGWTEGWIEERNLLNDIGCSCCRGLTVVKGINDVATTKPWMIKYFKNIEDVYTHTYSSTEKVIMKCPYCGREKKISIYVLNSDKLSCICSDKNSYPQKFVCNMLEQLKVIFETEYSPNWCKYDVENKLKQGRYDFYIEVGEKKYIIESDGEQHKNEGSKSSNWKSLEIQQNIDNYKDKLAIENKIKVIRINCEESNLEFIKDNILKSKLVKIFDLTKINWNKCEEFALSNRVKEACDLWNNDIKDTFKISKQMHLCRATIIKYLKKGSNLGWCNYNSKEEMIKVGKLFGKSILCTTTGRIFESASECSRVSEDIFGITLYTSNISSVCRGENTNTKGYHFKFI